MDKLSNKYKISITPKAFAESVVTDGKVRFSVLCDGLIRIEYSENCEFEDRATQTVFNRQFDKVDFKVKKDDAAISIITDRITLTYLRGKEFATNTLYAHFHGIRSSYNCYWHYGMSKRWNLKGTARTLDNVDGATILDDGIMSLDGFAELDDSKSLIVNENGWVEERICENIDFYLFAYKDDYYTALKAFYKLTGNVPLLPRYALGNMWSKYYPYTQDEYMELMERFKSEKYPFSVAVLDMNWHITDVDSKYGTGWTGYTWDKKLIPNYKKLLCDLHDRNMAVTLNIHPADGVREYEEMYPKMAEKMGVNDGGTIEFDSTNPNFIEKYFEVLLNTYDRDGVDFWWIDWQQGGTSKFKNFDPLWMLNHYHTIDKIKNGKRGLILSRYAGMGSHRYPLGFSGDTIMSWESLDFQPYFTATAANAGYTWWSHDLGGHMLGAKDDELIARWIQFGVFSPVCRLHSSDNFLMGKEPWNYDEVTERSMKKFLQLRHALVPYLYTMNYRNHSEGEPLIVPLYYDYPDEQYGAYDNAYRNEYKFGSEMIVMPITKKSDPITRMGNVKMLIPEGIWFDFFNGRKYNGKKSINLYRNIYEMPVLVKAGGIIPMTDGEPTNDVSNPKQLKVKVFAGLDNSFEMYEDAGEGLGYENGEYVSTVFEIKHSEKPVFTINEPVGVKSLIPDKRDYRVEFVGYTECGKFSVTENGIEKEFECNGNCVTIKNVVGEVKIFFEEKVVVKNNSNDDVYDFLLHCQGDNKMKVSIYNLIKNGADITDILLFFENNDVDNNFKMAVIELLTAER